jgi:hypothetical protein
MVLLLLQLLHVIVMRDRQPRHGVAHLVQRRVARQRAEALLGGRVRGAQQLLDAAVLRQRHAGDVLRGGVERVGWGEVERERQNENENERQNERVCVCVCVRERLCK